MRGGRRWRGWDASRSWPSWRRFWPHVADAGGVESPRFVTRRPGAHEARHPLFDLVPREAWVKLFEPRTHLAVPAHPVRLLRPATAAGRARLEVVVAGEAQDEEVGLGVVAAPHDAEAVMH